MKAQPSWDIVHVEKAGKSMARLEAITNLQGHSLARVVMLRVTQKDLNFSKVAFERSFVLVWTP